MEKFVKLHQEKQQKRAKPIMNENKESLKSMNKMSGKETR